jgi:predicted ribosomally synthesized peptide with SipW-like signal peptide
VSNKILLLTVLALIILGMVSGVTFASFADKESSNNNALITGTLDLKTNSANGVSAALTNLSLKPNNSITGTTIQLSNSGTVNGVSLNISFSYVENDNTNQNGTPNMTADQVAAVMQVTTMTYDTANLLSTFTDTNANGYIDVQDLINAANTAKMTGLSGLAAGGTSKPFNITVLLRDGISNDFQGDGITITVNFVLNQ